MDEESRKGQQQQKKAPIHTFISMKLIICCLIAPRAFWTLPCVLGKKGASHKSFKTTTPKTSWPVHHWASECWKAAFRPVPVGDTHNDAFCVVGENPLSESKHSVCTPNPQPLGFFSSKPSALSKQCHCTPGRAHANTGQRDTGAACSARTGSGVRDTCRIQVFPAHFPDVVSASSVTGLEGFHGWMWTEVEFRLFLLVEPTGI